MHGQQTRHRGWDSGKMLLREKNEIRHKKTQAALRSEAVRRQKDAATGWIQTRGAWC
jgi:hypothetical protein